MNKLIGFPLLIVLLVLLTSCSSSPKTNIITPSGEYNTDQPQVGVSDRFPDGSPASGIGSLGIFSLSLNADEITAELTSLRESSLVDVLEVVDITNFLRIAPCFDCAKIESVEIDIDGNLVVSIGIKHPFPAGDILKPVSGRNRGDLHVFNVEGTIVSNLAGTSFPGLGQTIANYNLVNADGLTPYLDSVLEDIYLTDASVHPYILHFDDYTAGNFDVSNPMGFASVTDPPPSGNLVMAMGCDYDYQDYVFNIDGSFDYIYAVGCTYAVSSANKAQRFTPEYRVPQHNKKAASEISVEIITNLLAEGDIASTASIEIHVVDINHGVAVGENINEMFADSSVAGITLEIPGVETGPVIVDISSPTGTGHDPSDPLVYTATITNTASGVEGVYSGLVKVVDSYSAGLNEVPLLNGMDGIKRVDPLINPLTGLFDISEFATYAMFEIPIAIVNEDPVADLIPIDEEVVLGDTIVWDATASTDPDGTIIQYEWDYDIADGLEENFATNTTTMTPICTQESSAYNTLGTLFAAVRVTDNLGATDIAIVSFEVVEQIYPIWQTTQGNIGNTGSVGLYGPANALGSPVWTTDECVHNALQIFLNEDMAFVSTVGIPSAAGYTAAINLSDGSLAWTQSFGGTNTYLACKGLSEDGSVVFCAQSSNGTLYGLNASDGTELWSTSGSIKCDAYPTLDLDGNFIVPASDGIRSMDPQTGAINWTAPIGNTYYCTPAVGSDGTIYAYSSISNCPLHALDPTTGADNWSSFPNIGECHNGITIHPDSGNIIIHTRDELRCYQDNGSSGTQLWQQIYPYSWYSSTAVGANGDIYLLDYSGTLRRIDSTDGTTIDSSSGWGNGYGVRPAIGADGLIYIGDHYYLRVFNPDCTLASSSGYCNVSYLKGPAIGQDGTVYAFNKYGVYAWRD